MMDGYSVQDAASVLGVPEGRVWELLARGVLSGTPEGDSMRVFLKAEAPAISRAAPHEALPPGNGYGGSHGGEASAFRELLTEFRNLTERYGQALLALGEARGEVAGLRSRVELLEARIDLRLPARVEAEPISWEAPAPQPPAPEAPAPEPPAPAEVEAVLPAPSPIERTSRPRKARSPRAAVAGFAEALARAQDPNVADVGEVLPADALPADQEGAETKVEAELAAEAPTSAEPTLDEAQLVAEAPVEEVQVVAEPAAEPAPPADATYRAAEVEPDWFADGDFSWLDAADLEARGETGVVAVEVGTAPAVMAFEPEPSQDATLQPEAAIDAELPPELHAAELEPKPVPGQDATLQPEAVIDAELPPEPHVAEFVAEPLVVAEPPVAPEAAASAGIGHLEPVEMGGSGEESVMWLGQPPEPAGGIEIAIGSPRTETGPAWPAADRGASTAQAVAPPLAMTEQELAQLARDEGWDDAEVAAIRAMISRPATGVELPGSAELDEAMSALQAVPIAPRSAPTPAAGSQWAKPATRDEETTPRDDWAFEAEPMPPPAPAPQPSPITRRVAPNQDWVRQRRGPAASAYRRIRRIFTG